jgi:hypothetical protein
MSLVLVRKPRSDTKAARNLLMTRWLDDKVARQELEEIRVLRDCREHFQIVSKRDITDSESAKVSSIPKSLQVA